MGFFDKFDPRKWLVGMLTDKLVDEIAAHLKAHFDKEHKGQIPTAHDYVEHIFAYLKRKVGL